MNETWDNPFEPCACSRRSPCACGGRVWEFVPEYRRVLQAYRPRCVYEWGPGISTAMALGFGARVHSVEHDKKYISIPEIPGIYTCAHVELDSASYTRPTNVEADLYFVDGRRRGECILNTAVMIMGRTSVLCLHDAQRQRYHHALKHWKHVKFLTRGFAVASFEPIEV